MKQPATSPEYDRFKSLLNKITAVPREEMLKREEAYQEQAAQSPKRGPKPKRKRKA